MKTEHGSAAGIPNPTVNAQARIAGPHKRQTEIIRDAYPAHGSLGVLAHTSTSVCCFWAPVYLNGSPTQRSLRKSILIVLDALADTQTPVHS